MHSPHSVLSGYHSKFEIGNVLDGRVCGKENIFRCWVFLRRSSAASEQANAQRSEEQKPVFKADV